MIKEKRPFLCEEVGDYADKLSLPRLPSNRPFRKWDGPPRLTKEREGETTALAYYYYYYRSNFPSLVEFLKTVIETEGSKDPGTGHPRLTGLRHNWGLQSGDSSSWNSRPSLNYAIIVCGGIIFLVPSPLWMENSLSSSSRDDLPLKKTKNQHRHC